MAERPLNVFNLYASRSPEASRLLAHLEVTGSEVVITQNPRINGETKQEKQRREDREFYATISHAIASRERIEEFQEKLDRYDEAATAALLENEEKLRVARKELQHVRDRAYELTRPDGSITKVYRDGEIVRDDDGAEVEAALIRPADIPATAPTWQMRREVGGKLDDLVRRNEEIREYREGVERARKISESGRMTEKELEEYSAGLDRMPADVRRHYRPQERSELDHQAAPTQAEGTLQASTRPTGAFLAAVKPEDLAELEAKLGPDVRPQGPSASAPSPR